MIFLQLQKKIHQTSTSNDHFSITRKTEMSAWARGATTRAELAFRAQVDTSELISRGERIPQEFEIPSLFCFSYTVSRRIDHTRTSFHKRAWTNIWCHINVLIAPSLTVHDRVRQQPSSVAQTNCSQTAPTSGGHPWWHPLDSLLRHRATPHTQRCTPPSSGPPTAPPSAYRAVT